MAARGITAEEVAEALAPRRRPYDSARRPDRLVVLGRTLAARRLEVVVVKADPAVVVTVTDRGKEV